MKKLLVLLILLSLVTAGITACDGTDDDSDKVAVNLISKLKNSRTVQIDNDLTVDTYNVIFYKVEIGNSEDDKFTLWENSDGKTINIASADQIEFEDVNKAVPGTYKYCRFTIGKTLTLEGTYQNNAGTASTVVNGNHDNISGDGTRAVYLFGTADVNDTNEYLIASPIDVKEGTTLSFIFDISSSVSYDNTNGLQLDGPSVEFTSE